MGDLKPPTLYFTHDDMQLLMKKASHYALQYCMNTCRHLYRCKPKEYFSSIQSADGIMKKYPKDSQASIPHGDPCSPINSSNPCERPKGLFFTANVNRVSGKLPPFSPFGDTRLVVPIETLI